MSVATPTVIPRPYRFPALLPKAPLSIASIQRRPAADGSTAHFAFSRDFAQDLDDLSDEEAELEAVLNNARNRGYSSIVPIGRTTTREEQKLAAGSDSESEDDDDSGEGMVSQSDELEEPALAGSDDSNDEEEDAMDMDAEMEDLDLVHAREENLSDEDMSS